jgi:16S rRNA processing protein RimM
MNPRKKTTPSTRVTTPSELNAGRIVGTFGLKGECKIDASRIGAGALGPGTVVHARLANGTSRDLRVAAVRLHKGRPLARFDGFDDATAAEALVGAALSVGRDDVTLGDGEFLDADLIGCTLVDARGASLGEVVGVEHYPAQDMLVVGAHRALVPLVRAFVKHIDVAAKRIEVEVPPGLLDERQAERG